MPSLQNLPAEILHLIAHFVGCDHFQAHPDTLLLFKSWCHEARIVAYEELFLTFNKVQKYLEAPNSIKHLVKASNTSLTVNLTGHFERKEALNNGSITPECEDRTIETLASLASHLKRMHRMNAFRLQCLILLNRLFAYNAGLMPMIISTLLEGLPRSLSRLTIDCYSGYRASRDGTVEAECPSSLLLNKDFIPSLRHLRLRSRFICPKIFDPFCSSAESQLESLIINTSLRVEQSCHPMNQALFSKSCHGTDFLQSSRDLCTKLRDAANAKLPQLTSIKVLRILQHKRPYDDVLSYDVLSDRTVILPENANWEDAGCHDDGTMTLSDSI